MALESLFFKKTVDKKNPNMFEFHNLLTKDKKNKFLFKLCKEIMFDLKPLNKKLILDSFHLDVKEAKEKLEENFDIYCLGMPNETVSSLMQSIRENDTMFDWTTNIGQFRLEMVCQTIIERSKRLQKECKKYNIPFFDTSGNRKEKLKFAIEEIKKKSINY